MSALPSLRPRRWRATNWRANRSSCSLLVPDRRPSERSSGVSTMLDSIVLALGVVSHTRSSRASAALRQLLLEDGQALLRISKTKRLVAARPGSSRGAKKGRPRCVQRLISDPSHHAAGNETMGVRARLPLHLELDGLADRGQQIRRDEDPAHADVHDGAGLGASAARLDPEVAAHALVAPPLPVRQFEEEAAISRQLAGPVARDHDHAAHLEAGGERLRLARG